MKQLMRDTSPQSWVKTYQLSSVGGGVALVPAAAAEAVVQTLAEAADDAADTGAHQEESDDSQDQPDPDVGSTFPVESSNAGVLVAVSHVLQTVVVRNAFLSPEWGEEPVDVLLSITKSFVDVVLSVEQLSGG